MDQICAGQGKTSGSGKIDTVSDFLTELGRVVGDQSAVIVLEGAERLREEGSFLQVCFTPLETVVHSEHVVFVGVHKTSRIIRLQRLLCFGNPVGLEQAATRI